MLEKVIHFLLFEVAKAVIRAIVVVFATRLQNRFGIVI